MKREHSLLVKFSVLIFVLFLGMAFTFTLILPYLEYLGFDDMSRMLITALGALLTIIGQVVVGYLCDKFKTDKKVFYVIVMIFAVVNWFLYSFNGNSLTLIVVWSALMSAMFMMTQGVLDSWIIESEKYCLQNYGWIRAFGAVGWAVGAYLNSLLFNRWGYTSLGIAFALVAVLVLLLAFFIPDAQKVETKEKLKISDVKELVFNREFIILTLVFLFINIVSWTDSLSVVLKIGELGAKANMSKEEVNSFINLKNSFQAICELPLFFLGGRLVKKFGAVKIVMFAIVMLSLRFALSGFAVSPNQLVWVSSLQLVTFPLIMICSKMLIDSASPAHLRASGQQFAGAVYGGLSSLTTPLLCGWLGSVFSHNFVLFGAASLCVVPFALLLLVNKNKTMES